MGGKTLHGERGDRCRSEAGIVRCRKRQRKEKGRDESRDSESDVDKEIKRK